MDIALQTAWVTPPYETGGLDHLGVQAPCIQIYSQLLPGITNVTDRARYYSFYLWLFNEFDKKGWRQKDEIVNQLRKADCLFSLISIRHGQKHGDFTSHAGSAVGSNTLTSVVSQLENKETIRLSDYTHFNDNDKSRYFKNPFGGLGQYYFGVLYELKLMSGASVSSARLIKKTGAKIANAMSNGVSGDAFMRALESDEVTSTHLDELCGFCHCQLTTSDKEAALLIDVFRDGWPAITGDDEDVDSLEGNASSAARSKSLALLINLTGLCAINNIKFDVYLFRGMTYSQCDTENQLIANSEALSPVAAYWQVYQRNELLAVAMQGLFFSMLRAVDLNAGVTSRKFMSTRELSKWFWHEGPGHRALNLKNIGTLKDALNSRCNGLPAFGDWCNAAHEIQLAEKIVKLTGQSALGSSELEVIITMSFDVLAAICCRKENQDGYNQVQFRAGYLDPYPVNLISVPLSINQLLCESTLVDGLVKFTTHFCLDSHLRVALRKLRQQGQNTSRFELTENGLVIKSIPPATHTSPRFYQAMGILRDLGLIIVDGELLVPSESGLDFVTAVS